jgi:hypothetical protein
VLFKPPSRSFLCFENSLPPKTLSEMPPPRPSSFTSIRPSDPFSSGSPDTAFLESFVLGDVSTHKYCVCVVVRSRAPKCLVLACRTQNSSCSSRVRDFSEAFVCYFSRRAEISIPFCAFLHCRTALRPSSRLCQGRKTISSTCASLQSKQVRMIS